MNRKLIEYIAYLSKSMKAISKIECGFPGRYSLAFIIKLIENAV
jgi:hypothetical protein